MTREEVKEKIKELTKKLEHHEYLYYVCNQQEISDSDFDKLLKELEELEEMFPDLRKPNSPTVRVGGLVDSSFAKVTHEVQMTSLQDVFEQAELDQFDVRVRKKIKKPIYAVEPKVDGISISLEYRNGMFVRGSTRGDGFVGEDVTENLRTVRSIPLNLKEPVAYLEVRGEVYMSLDHFMKLVRQQELQDETPFKNPRNAASGSIRQKDSKVTALRMLDAVIFNVQQIEGHSIRSHQESLKYLRTLGFVTVDCQVFNDMEGCKAQIQQIGDKRGRFPYGIDGAVIKLDELADRNMLGSGSKYPRWAIAYKYPPECKETVIRDIQVQVGRTGVLTPVAVLEPVLLSGSTVSRASLHNRDYIEEKEIRVGDTVLVQKAGDVIPEVEKVVRHAPGSKPFLMPDDCPVCGSDVVKSEDEVALRCENPECPATQLRNIIHFASQKAMGIEGLGIANVSMLLDCGLIQCSADIYKLTKEDLLPLERFQDRAAQRLMDHIEASKQNELWRLIYGLGIPGVGENIAKLLCENFNGLDQIMNASVGDLRRIFGLGHVVANNITRFFSLPQTQELVERFRKAGLRFQSPQKGEGNGNALEGLTFVLTGTLPSMARNEMKRLIEENGGKVTSGISSKTSFLVAGENPGSKWDIAQQLGTQILSQEDVIEKIKCNGENQDGNGN